MNVKRPNENGQKSLYQSRNLAVSMLDHLDVCEEVNNITEPPLVQFMTGKVFRQDVFETLAFFLNAAHCIIDHSTNFRGMCC